jgi:hypothetical protein
MGWDSEMTIAGVGLACTGIGQTKDDPKWKAYSVRIEFANPKSAYFAGEDVTLMGPKGDTVADVSCEGAWLLLNLPAGTTYKIEARLTDPPTAPRTSTISASGKGQKTFVVVFPDAQ